MTRPYLISAIGTPLQEDESLHMDGLYAHLEQHHDAKIDGILAAGTMGLMQLLRIDTYHHLVKTTCEAWAQRGELLVGIGDTSFSRTKARLEFVNDHNVDGVVVLSPFFVPFTQAELIDYYRALADYSRTPIFLYDLPERAGVSLDVETVLRLSEHPCIAGIKCSGSLTQIQRLRQELNGAEFRVIIAKPVLLDVLVRSGMQEHVDGIFAIAPHWMRRISELLNEKQWGLAEVEVRRLATLLDSVERYGVFQSITEILNAVGVPGNFAPRPYAPLDDEQRQSLLNEPVVLKYLEQSES